MAIGKTLSEVVSYVQEELGLSAVANLGIDVRERIKGRIRSAHEEIATEHEWLHLRAQTTNAWWDKVTSAGQRYYDWPAGMDPMTITKVFYEFGDSFIELTRGISPTDYTAFNSDEDVRSSPAQKWDWHGTTQFELWPMPPSDAITVRFQARANPLALTAETDVLVIDHIAVGKLAASRYLTSKDPKASATFRAEAMRRIRLLLHYQNRGTLIDLGGMQKPTDPLDPRTRIRVVSGSGT